MLRLGSYLLLPLLVFDYALGSGVRWYGLVTARGRMEICREGHTVVFSSLVLWLYDSRYVCMFGGVVKQSRQRKRIFWLEKRVFL